MDAWQGENYYLDIDGVTHATGSYSVPTSGTNTCPAKSYTINIHHTNTSFELKLRNTLTQAGSFQSLAYNSINFYIYTCAYDNCANCSNDSVCDTCILNATLTADGNCLCNKGLWSNVDPKCDYSVPCATCSPCNRNCETCISDQACSTCYPNALLSQTTGDCICNQGFWNNGDIYCDYTKNCSFCVPCNSTCNTCNSSSNCMSCYFNASLNSQSQCVCDDRFYMENSSFNRQCEGKNCSFCHLCDISCKTCEGLDSNQCLSCFQYYTLFNGSCIPNQAIGFKKYILYYFFTIFFIK